MTDGITADLSEVHRLAADLGKITGGLVPKVDAVVKKGAQNVKDEMVADAAGSRHFRGLARTISYDRAYGLGSIGYEVGPDASRGGVALLDNIAYFGGSNGGGGTLDLDGPLRAEEPRMVKALGDLMGNLL